MPATVFFPYVARVRALRCHPRQGRAATLDAAETPAREGSIDLFVSPAKAAAALGAADCAMVHPDGKTGSALSAVLAPLGTCQINPLL